MKLYILFGKTCKQPHSNYPRLDYKIGIASIEGNKWEIECDDVWGFFSWLQQRFGNEIIDRRNQSNINMDVLVVNVDNYPDDYCFFYENGELSKLICNNKLQDLYNEFLNDTKKQYKALK